MHKNKTMEFHIVLINKDGTEVLTEKNKAPCKVKEYNVIFEKVLNKQEKEGGTIHLKTVK